MAGTELHIGRLKYLQELFRLRNCKFLKHVIPNVRVLYKKKMNKSIQKEIMHHNNTGYEIEVKVTVLNTRHKDVNSTNKIQCVGWWACVSVRA